MRHVIIGIATGCLALGMVMNGAWLLRHLPAMPGPTIPLQSTGAFLWVNDPLLMTQWARSQLTPEQWLATHALLRTWEHRALGPAVTMLDDVLPALHAALLWWDASTGDWVLRATVRTGETGDMLEALHASFAAGIPQIRRTQMLLDDRFPFDTLEATDQAVSDTTTQEQEWTVRVTRSLRGSGTFISARRGQEMLLGNNLTIMRAHGMEPFTPPAAWRGIHALGIVPRSLLFSDLAPVLMPTTTLTTLRSATGTVIPWALRKRGDAWELSLP